MHRRRREAVGYYDGGVKIALFELRARLSRSSTRPKSGRRSVRRAIGRCAVQQQVPYAERARIHLLINRIARTGVIELEPQ